MSIKKFKFIRLAIVAAVAITVSLAVSSNDFWLALAGVLTGMLFLSLVRFKSKKVLVDEMIENISGKAARASYSINVLVLLFLTLYFIVTGNQKDDLYAQTMGMVFAFVILFQVALYSIAFYYHKYRYGHRK